MQAARDLLADGRTVTVTAAATKAGISKATAYRYYSEPAILVAEAGLDIEVLPYEAVVAGCGTTRDKLRAISLYYLDLAIEHEAGFCRYVGLTLLSPREAVPGLATRRGGRRLAMYEAAFEEHEPKVSPEARTACIQALATATGAEAMISLLDVVGTDRQRARFIVGEIAEAVIDRYLGRPGDPV
ncbi:hypothetical protein OB2597_11316 [Pseudooceanicola batsensis HTCC2597]|uniref:HTH tetR-type domain-containing protein n=1 Tax=Pseudooceanicola batsensis (strain ATCC BAA-863 / DSM 15984 / KCTC 12145 / HTCC2597) TaxID=252305 RepID=A3TW33_PSEBH|nr:hypothetical protein OB2597_11316 [Pseudooceanicola batsensis HTCC2597]